RPRGRVAVAVDVIGRSVAAAGRRSPARVGRAEKNRQVQLPDRVARPGSVLRQRIVQRGIVEIGKQKRIGAPALPRKTATAVRAAAAPLPRGQNVVDIMIIVQGQSELLQIVLALRSAGRFASLLNGWQKKCY